MQHSTFLKTLCLTFAFIGAMPNSLQGIELSDVIKMPLAERAEYLRRESIEDLQDLKTKIVCERGNTAMQSCKHKRRSEIGWYHSFSAQVVEMASITTLVASLISVGYRVSERLPENFELMPAKSLLELLWNNTTVTCKEAPTKVLLLSSSAVIIASGMYELISRSLTAYSKSMRLKLLEKHVTLYKLEEAVNQVIKSKE